MDKIEKVTGDFKFVTNRGDDTVSVLNLLWNKQCEIIDVLEDIQDQIDVDYVGKRLDGKISVTKNQSQKQLEEEYKCGTLEVLKNPKLRKELLQKDNQVIKKNLTTEEQPEIEKVQPYKGYEPEKQEEWREEISLRKEMKKKIPKCELCKKMDKTVKERTVKENGVLGYYDITVKWCDSCVVRHNHYLLSSWGGE